MVLKKDIALLVSIPLFRFSPHYKKIMKEPLMKIDLMKEDVKLKYFKTVLFFVSLSTLILTEDMTFLHLEILPSLCRKPN